MSISSLLNIGSRAMNASYAQLQVTGNNIANANTAGYSRQSAELQTAFSQQTGSGFFGKGVDVATVTRAHSDFLTREVATSRAVAAADDARSEPAAAARERLSDRRGRPRLRGAAGVQRLRRRRQQPAGQRGAPGRARPRSATSRRACAARASRWTRSRRAWRSDLRTAVASINALTQQIADLNRRIANAKGSGHDAERPARPARHGDQRPLAVRPGDDGGRRRRQRRRLPRRRQKLVLGGNATALTTVRRRLRPDQAAARHHARAA